MKKSQNAKLIRKEQWFSADRPIESARADVLGRSGFAAWLAASIDAWNEGFWAFERLAPTTKATFHSSPNWRGYNGDYGTPLWSVYAIVKVKPGAALCQNNRLARTRELVQASAL